MGELGVRGDSGVCAFSTIREHYDQAVDTAVLSAVDLNIFTHGNERNQFPSYLLSKSAQMRCWEFRLDPCSRHPRANSRFG